MGVLVLLRGEQHRDVDDRDNGVVRVEDRDWPVESGADGAPLLRGIDAQVARQRGTTHDGPHVDRVVVREAVGRGRVESQVLEPVVGAVAHRNHPVARVVRAAVVGRKLAVLRHAALAAIGDVSPGPGVTVKRVDVVAAVPVAQVDVLTGRRDGEPRRRVREGWVLAEVAGALPDDRAIERRLRQLLIVVGVVQELRPVLGRHLEPVRRAIAERAPATREELAACAVWRPLDQTVEVGLAVVLVGEDDVAVSVGHQAMGVHDAGALRGLQLLGNVLVHEITLSADDRRRSRRVSQGREE